MVAWLIFLILAVYVLIATRDFLYPLALAILLAYLLYPIVSFLEKRGVPRIPSNFVALIVGGAVLGGLGYFIYTQTASFVDDWPSMKGQAKVNLLAFERSVESLIGYERSSGDRLYNKALDAIDFGGDSLGKVFGATTSTLTAFGLMPVYVFFMLYYRNKFKEFVLMLVPDSSHKESEEIITEISEVTGKYIGGVVTVVSILCVLNSVGLMIVGIEYAILLGILSALMNLIPYFGTLIGAVFPLSYALLIDGNPNTIIGVVILFAILQFTENNILTANITGGVVKINPLITILVIIIGAKIWGVPGMFLAIPYLGMFKIFCQHIEFLKPYAFLIGTEGTEKHAVNMDNIKGFFSRLPFFKIRKK
ncbi:MAG: AI-2E family transporter [Cyclobacteriaceae bacterium]|nr:AI-2E family transporter [Cyclobacteriaceae bacterium]